MERLHVDVVCRSTTSETDAIRDHGSLLAEALAARDGTTALAYDLRQHDDARDLGGVLADQQGLTRDARHVLVVQYSPNSFARHGAAWWLPWALRRLRRTRQRTTVVLLVHELWLTMDSLRNVILSPPQRAVFALLDAVSDLVVVSTESLAARITSRRRPPIGVLPVGSNIPDARSARAATRRRLGVAENQCVVAAFGTRHPSRLLAHLRSAVEAVTASDPAIQVLNLGASAPPLEGAASRGRVLTPGYLASEELARHVAAADLLLLPFSDGVATRRTTVMAGMQHGVAILGTDGVNTSAELRCSAAMALVDAREPPAVYARHACDLIADAAERQRLGRSGRTLYEARFAWPRIADQLVQMIERA